LLSSDKRYEAARPRIIAMYYGLCHFLNFDTHLIDQIRRKYDPTVNLIEPHIGVLFSVPGHIGEGALIEHTNTVLRSWHSFPIRIHGLLKSWDHWLLLVLEKGNAEVSGLHRDIYSGILADYRRKDIEFIPHIALGLFVEQTAAYDYKNPRQMKCDVRKYEAALREAESLGLDFDTVFDTLQLIKLSDDFSQAVKGREFSLK
jgi:hypothetical protein